MYVLQEKPDDVAILQNGGIIKPVATLKDESGGVSHIAIDDHCYILLNGSKDRPFRISSWWYKEAVKALRKLPLPR